MSRTSDIYIRSSNDTSIFLRDCSYTTGLLILRSLDLFYMELTYGAKVFAQMSNYLTPSCRLLNQSNFFLLERAKYKLQILYQTYFSRTYLRRRKSQKPNTSKKVLATLPSTNIIFYFLLVFLHQKRNEKTC